jgi:hypothetical protein
MKENRALVRWGATCALVSGLVMIAPLVFYFYVLPNAGSSATHAADPASFLPWMAAQGAPRVALWWIVAAAFLVMLLGAPMGLRVRLAGRSGRDIPAREIEAAAWVAERAGVIGCTAIVVACLMLAAGEPALARAYVGATPDAQAGIVATYEWQRLVTALLFDVLGFALVGVWIGTGSVAGLVSGRLPKALAGLGIAAGVLCLCVAVGYLSKVGWLGEMGLGAAAFVAVPAWLIWLGVVLGR